MQVGSASVTVFAGMVRMLFVWPSMTMSLVVVKVTIVVEGRLGATVPVASSRRSNCVNAQGVSSPNTEVKVKAMAMMVMGGSNILKVQGSMREE